MKIKATDAVKKVMENANITMKDSHKRTLVSKPWIRCFLLLITKL